MLNFDKMRKLSGKMLEQAYVYAEAFWQGVFDSIEFNADYPFCDDYEGIKEFFPEGADPNEQFENVSFMIEYDCKGEFAVIFRYDEPHAHIPVTISVLQEVLVKNGFARVVDEDYKTVFSRVI